MVCCPSWFDSMVRARPQQIHIFHPGNFVLSTCLRRQLIHYELWPILTVEPFMSRILFFSGALGSATSRATSTNFTGFLRLSAGFIHLKKVFQIMNFLNGKFWGLNTQPWVYIVILQAKQKPSTVRLQFWNHSALVLILFSLSGWAHADLQGPWAAWLY